MHPDHGKMLKDSSFVPCVCLDRITTRDIDKPLLPLLLRQFPTSVSAFYILEATPILSIFQPFKYYPQVARRESIVP